MSTACRSKRSSISRRIGSVHGSAPKIPIRGEEARGSRPLAVNSSSSASMYDGVIMTMSGLKSSISITCRWVMPPETGTTVQPSRSAP